MTWVCSSAMPVHLRDLDLRFPICKMEVIILPIPLRCDHALIHK